MASDPRVHRGVGFVALLFVTCVAVKAQVVRPVTDVAVDWIEHGPAALDDSGTAVFGVSTANPFGTNPRHAHQIMRWELPVGTGSQLTQLMDGTGGSVSVSDDGQWLAFISHSNPLGQNHDESLELFVMRPDGTELAQITSDIAPNAGRVKIATISGSGSRIVFLANTDPLGTNPTHHYQVFVVDRDGSALRQLTSVITGDFSGVSLSDDGSRVVFGHDVDTTSGLEIFAVNSDGSGLRQVEVEGWQVSGPMLSGDGSTITYSYHDSSSGQHRVRVITWEGAYRWEGSGANPSIRDNGKVVYFEDSSQILARDLGTNMTTLLTATSNPATNVAPVVSGSGNRVVFRSYGGVYPGGVNPDEGPELMVVDADGGNFRQLTLNQVRGIFNAEPVITADGSRIVYLAQPSDFGTSTEEPLDVYRMQADGSDLVRVTQLDDWVGARWMSASDDGNTIVFVATADPTGQNPTRWFKVFRVFADGTGLIQLSPPGTSDPSLAFASVISADGSVVFFEADGGRVFRVAADGTGLAQILDDNSNTVKYLRSTAAGEWIVFNSSSNADGANADGSQEIFRVRGDGTGLERLTSDPEHGSGAPDVSGDGQRIVYMSEADPFGTNPEHNYEIFVYEVATGTGRQLTAAASGDSGVPRLSRDGSYAYFSSNASIFESAPGGFYEGWGMYRVSIASGQIERVSGLRDTRGSLPYGSPITNKYPAVSGDGNRAAFAGRVNPTDGNPDLSHEIWIADWSQPARVYVGKEAPTLVSWDADPRPVRYDVIRGDVANLGLGAGGTVDLGVVICLEDNSPDTHTAGFEDPAQPGPGQVLFFLHRGSQGLAAGPGSWGEGSDGRERVATAGDCAP